MEAVDSFAASELIFERAVRYPYRLPSGSFLFDGTKRTERLSTNELSAWSENRYAVLGVGSNGSPEQLARKFALFAGSPLFPVLGVTVHEHDVVYAARVSAYGAVPATIIESATTTVEIKLTLLDKAQLDWMNDTESLGRAYELVDIDPNLIEVEGRALTDLVSADTVVAYEATAGPLRIDGEPVALSAVRGTNRQVRIMTEEQILSTLAARFGLDARALVVRAVTDRTFRSKLIKSLRDAEGRIEHVG